MLPNLKTFVFYLVLIDLDKEEEDGKVGGDRHPNVELHCLHLFRVGSFSAIIQVATGESFGVGSLFGSQHSLG